jgi:hypothetical protein
MFAKWPILAERAPLGRVSTAGLTRPAIMFVIGRVLTLLTVLPLPTLLTLGAAANSPQRRFQETRPPRPSYWLFKWGRSFSFSVQKDSRRSLSGSRSSVTLKVNGLVKILGSSMVTCNSIWPKSRRRKRS